MHVEVRASPGSSVCHAARPGGGGDYDRTDRYHHAARCYNAERGRRGTAAGFGGATRRAEDSGRALIADLGQSGPNRWKGTSRCNKAIASRASP
jgi:hypothetical protein